ncbi:Membrane protein involved in the export of O-antigen, teichoic acid lipoteichoic acids [Arthrobacter sp. 9AX]|uniref:flippase n=1 Tax=Arthrobacter sp. 9AX TaxID=2653131 RepID=UPI0012F0E3B2|nr:flippase [Arthrobacter sp. 9AX]VXB79829.1 Membrane protein involved in the export of O-antigen, teichoic acid lipoteichoic acids [Arthrobacter sp. 9AX]
MQTPDELHPVGRSEVRRDRAALRRSPAKTRKSIGLLLLIQVSALAVPLATMPFLTRVLGPSAWGNLAAIQALAVTLSIVVEYGYQYTATRSVSLVRESREKVNAIIGNVFGAKIALSLVAALIAVCVYFMVPSFQESGVLFLVGVFHAVVLGWSPLWYFQAMERLEGAAAVDVTSKVISALCIFIAVRDPDDGVLVLGAQAALTAVATSWNMFRMTREAGLPTVQVRGVGKSLIEGFPLFLYRAVVTIYAAGSTAVLRGMSTSVETGNYANADRLTSAAKSLIVPIGQVMFPKISRLHAENPMHAKRLMMTSLAGVTIPFLLAAVAGIFLSPWLLPLFFGPDYTATIPIFQVLCLTLPLVAASNVLGIQWMLARGQEKAFNILVVSSALGSITSMLILVPQFGGVGMAWSVIVAEGLLVLTMILYAAFSRK